MSDAERGAERISELLKSYRTGHPHTDMVECLADMRHYCDVEGISFGDADKEAHQTYLCEREVKGGGN